MIYDDDLDITWLQDANYAQTSGHDADGRMSWDNAVAWADGLSYEGYNDWRLPTLNPVNDTAFDYNFTYDGSNRVSMVERYYDILLSGSFTYSAKQEYTYDASGNLDSVPVYDDLGGKETESDLIY